MTADEHFAQWVSSKRMHLLGLAKELDAQVMRARANGGQLAPIHEAREEYARRLKDAAEALGPTTIDPAAAPEDWGPSEKPGHVHCNRCKVDVKDVRIGKLRHAGSKAHRDAMALQVDT